MVHRLHGVFTPGKGPVVSHENRWHGNRIDSAPYEALHSLITDVGASDAEADELREAGIQQIKRV